MEEGDTTTTTTDAGTETTVDQSTEIPVSSDGVVRDESNTEVNPLTNIPNNEPDPVNSDPIETYIKLNI